MKNKKIYIIITLIIIVIVFLFISLLLSVKATIFAHNKNKDVYNYAVGTSLLSGISLFCISLGIIIWYFITQCDLNKIKYDLFDKNKDKESKQKSDIFVEKLPRREEVIQREKSLQGKEELLPRRDEPLPRRKELMWEEELTQKEESLQRDIRIPSKKDHIEKAKKNIQEMKKIFATSKSIVDTDKLERLLEQIALLPIDRRRNLKNEEGIYDKLKAWFETKLGYYQLLATALNQNDPVVQSEFQDMIKEIDRITNELEELFNNF